MLYKIAEKFKSVQGEGAYAGTPMAFIRFVGCSVGKRICQHCDTDFESMHNWRGGGEFSVDELLTWVGDYRRICLTGGEPLDQDLEPLIMATTLDRTIHIETSGTKSLDELPEGKCYVCVSPKPGFKEESVMAADEIKVIVPGLGEINRVVSDHWAVLPHNYKTHNESGGEMKRWPTLEDALRWADAGKVVYLQPRNGKFDIDQNNLRIVQDILTLQPSLRLSVQMHKILRVQ